MEVYDAGSLESTFQPRRGRRGSGRILKWNLFIAFTLAAISIATRINLAQSQQLNTPPILYVPERNWRIPENEKVGQIIARIRAEDAENDELEFGLEPHSLTNLPHNDGDTLPFRIDPVAGVVYLNDSLKGRAGENFFLYITVSDGQLLAKTEVFVNVLTEDGNRNVGLRGPSSLTNVVQNISQFLPAFDQLPGVQSIRNQRPNYRPANNLPFPSSNRGVGYNISSRYPPPVFHSIANTHLPKWAQKNDFNLENPIDTGSDEDLSMPTSSSETGTGSFGMTATTSRTKLSPIGGSIPTPTKSENSSTESSPPNVHQTSDSIDSPTPTNPSSIYSYKALMIPIISVCGLLVAVTAILIFLYRARLCAIGKSLKKKTKEDMVKKSNQSNFSSNLTDDSRNSMVMQQWNGPTAYGNRYVPWERDQQPIQYSMTTSRLTAGNNNNAAASGMQGSDAIEGGVVGGSNASNAINNDDRQIDRWEFPRHRLKFFNILGEGAFGQVWRCEALDIDGLEGVTTVAVKTLKENADEIEKKDLLSELEVMKSLEPHVNVVRLLGCCTEKDPIFVIIEYVNKGKLQTYLRNSRAERHYGNTHGNSNVLTSGDLTSFMYQVAKGMDYLTSRGIIHRDLAARNILITEDRVCKVADFGFARDVVTSKIYERKSEGKLPIRWMAVESLYDNIFSAKSDVWSFGILMWEIVTLGSTPYPGVSAADVMRKVRDGYRLEKPEHCRRELYNIMYYCWSNDANERPTFSEVVRMLDKLLHTEMDYIALERFPEHNYYNIVNISGEKL